MRKTAITLLALPLISCADPSWIELGVDWEDGVEDAIDVVVIDVVASGAERSSELSTSRCAWASATFEVGAGAAEPPLELVFAAESEQWRWVAVRVTGSLGSERAIRNEGLFPFPHQDEWELTLTDSCLERDCPEGQVCFQDSGECVESMAAPLLELGGCEEL